MKSHPVTFNDPDAPTAAHTETMRSRMAVPRAPKFSWIHNTKPSTNIVSAPVIAATIPRQNPNNPLPDNRSVYQSERIGEGRPRGRWIPAAAKSSFSNASQTLSSDYGNNGLRQSIEMDDAEYSNSSFSDKNRDLLARHLGSEITGQDLQAEKEYPHSFISRQSKMYDDDGDEDMGMGEIVESPSRRNRRNVVGSSSRDGTDTTLATAVGIAKDIGVGYAAEGEGEDTAMMEGDDDHYSPSHDVL